MQGYRRPFIRLLFPPLLLALACAPTSCTIAQQPQQTAATSQAATATPSSSPTPAKSPDRKDRWWWLRVRADKHTYLVRADGQLKKELSRRIIAGELSPDESRVLSTQFKEGFQTFVADLNGQNRRPVTATEPFDPDARWSPDGRRILFSSMRSGTRQIYLMDADGANLRQVTNDEEGAFNARFAPDGRIAYLAHRSKRRLEELKKLSGGARETPKGAFDLVDLLVTDARTSTTLVRNSLIRDVAWSPNGGVIAYSLMDGGGKLVFLHLSDGVVREIASSNIDARLVGYVAHDLRWRPDGNALALRLEFMGGTSPNAREPFGGGQLFIIPLDGKPNWFDIEPRAAFDWITSSELPQQ